MALMSHSFIARGYRCWTLLPTFVWAGFLLFSLAVIRFTAQVTTARERCTTSCTPCVFAEPSLPPGHCSLGHFVLSGLCWAPPSSFPVSWLLVMLHQTTFLHILMPPFHHKQVSRRHSCTIFCQAYSSCLVASSIRHGNGDCSYPTTPMDQPCLVGMVIPDSLSGIGLGLLITPYIPTDCGTCALC